MSWWGKLAGGSIGFALGGPLGAMLGAVLGHQVDKASARKISSGFTQGTKERTQAAFFSAHGQLSGFYMIN